MSFLQLSMHQVKHQINGIFSSYNNDWDLLAEGLQNSLDALKKSKEESKKIRISVDVNKKSLEIYDNGIGINPDDLPELIKPFSTNKNDDVATIGEKGVGLTFLIFNCNNFYIKSGNSNGTSEVIIKDAYNWLSSESLEDPTFVYRSIEEEFKGTIIKMENILGSPIFDWTFEQLLFILRTRTAVGYTMGLWEDGISIDIDVKYTDFDGQIKVQNIPSEYRLLTEKLSKGSIIYLEDFKRQKTEKDLSDIQKRSLLRDKVIVHTKKFQRDNREIKVWSCFVPKRSVWNIISLNEKLCNEEELNSDQWKNEKGLYCQHVNGIFTSVKGMPTGIQVSPDIRGAASYWGNIFMIFEYSGLSFDIGRKSLHGPQVRMLQKYSTEIFNEFYSEVKNYVAGDIDTRGNSKFNRDQIIAQIQQLPDLKSIDSSFVKDSSDQEAFVAALFYEQIGKGVIKDYLPYSTGYKGRYDALLKWGDRFLFTEFKTKPKYLLRDFSEERKMFDEIDLLICWEVTSEDKAEFSKKAIEIDEINRDFIFSDMTNVPPLSTHQLIMGSSNPINVIELKRFFELQQFS